jgi:hypothetical protein
LQLTGVDVVLRFDITFGQSDLDVFELLLPNAKRLGNKSREVSTGTEFGTRSSDELVPVGIGEPVCACEYRSSEFGDVNAGNWSHALGVDGDMEDGVLLSPSGAGETILRYVSYR